MSNFHADSSTLFIRTHKKGIKTQQDELIKKKKSLCSNFARRSKQLPPPLAAHLLEPADDLAADAAGFALTQAPVPLAALDEAEAFLAVLVLAAQLRDEVARGAQPARGR